MNAITPASVNRPTMPEGIRHAGARVLISGKEVSGLVKASVVNNGYYHADSYDIETNVYADPRFGIDYWGAIDPSAAMVVADVQVLDQGRWVSLIQGQVDRIRIDVITGSCTLTGRDFAGVLIDTKTSMTYLNLTSSEVAQAIAAAHGLTCDADPTTALVSTYYKADHTHVKQAEFSKQVTEWDMLVKLAKLENYDIYFKGTQLCFKKKLAGAAAIWTVICPSVAVARGVATLGQSNVMHLEFDRSLTFSKDIQVTVQSWHTKNKVSTKASAIKRAATAAARNAAEATFGQDGFAQTAKASGSKASANSASGATVYTYVIPNLTPAEAMARAQEILANLTIHEREIAWEEVGSTLISPRMQAVVTGPGGSWTQSYSIVSISRRVDMHSGYTMSVTAKNLPPQFETSDE